MVHKVVQIGSKVLRKISKRVNENDIKSEEIINLKKDLLDTLRAQPIGVAISAVQINRPIQIFLVEIKPTSSRPELKATSPQYFINPEIIEYSKSQVKMYEGCLSIVKAQLFGEVERPKKVKLRYLDEDGKERIELFDGFMARVIQHELDHINGRLFTDIVDVSTLMDLDEYRKLRSKKNNKVKKEK